MSPRDWFWFLAGVLVAVAIMAMLRPWLRERPAQTVRPVISAFAVPIAAALALIGVALGVYFLLGSPETIASAHTSAADHSSTSAASTNSGSQMGQSGTSAGSLDEVTEKLATRLATQGGSDADWQLLAESYEYMGRAADAKAARAHVASAASGESASVATTNGDGTGSGGTGAANMDSGTMAAVANALDGNLRRVNSASSADATANSVVAARTVASASAVGDHLAAAISGTVEIVSKLASRASPGATLFIYAKQPNTPGPPLAVVRLRIEHWPVSFTLDDANAMVPGRNLSTASSVQIEARISRSGDAIAQSGDLVGTVTGVNPRGGHPVKISIDREIG